MCCIHWCSNSRMAVQNDVKKIHVCLLTSPAAVTPDKLIFVTNETFGGWSGYLLPHSNFKEYIRPSYGHCELNKTNKSWNIEKTGIVTMFFNNTSTFKLTVMCLSLPSVYDHKQQTLKHKNTQTGSKSTKRKSQTMNISTCCSTLL